MSATLARTIGLTAGDRDGRRHHRRRRRSSSSRPRSARRCRRSAACCSSGSRPARSPGSARASAPSSRPPTRGPAASTSSCARCFRRPPDFCGAGRCSGACTRASSRRSRWCSAATSRRIVPLNDLGIRLVAVGGDRGALGDQLRRRAAAAARCRPALTIAKIARDRRAADPAVRHRARRAMPAPLAAIAPRGFLRALVAGLFAFGGWHMVTYAAEETRDPERTIPARADDRHRGRRRHLPRAEQRATCWCCRSIAC